MRLSSILTPIAAIAVSVLLPPLSQAQSDTDIELAEKLNAAPFKYYDYSVYLLDTVLKGNPADADRVKIMKARTLFNLNKMEEGEAIIKSITAGSKYYADSRYALGELLYMRKKEKEAVQAFEEYFNFYSKPENLPKDKVGREQYIKGCMGYMKTLYTNLGDNAGIDKVSKYFEALPSESSRKKKTGEGEDDDGKGGGEDAEAKLMKAQMKLDVAEKQKAEGNKAYETTVNAVRKDLKDLMWRGMDPLAAQAYTEDARCLILLGRTKEAVDILVNNKKLFDAFTESYKEQKQGHWSPEAFAIHYEARGNLELANEAKKGGKADEAKDLYVKALTGFVRHIKSFPENARAGQSMSYMNECKSILEKEYGKKIVLPSLPAIKGQAESAEIQRAKSLRDDNKFAEAIDLFLKEYPKHKGMGDSGADILFNLTYCYLKMGRLLEGNAVAVHLAENFEDFDKSPNALLMAGEAYWKEKRFAEGSSVYELYLMRYPTHQFAGGIATILANNAYNAACKMGEEANKLPAGQEKNDKNKKAREMFASAIPLFARIVNNYSNNPEYANAATYQLGRCYTNAEDYVKAAECFLSYCEMENAPDKLSQVADAKFFVGQDYYQEGDVWRKKFEKLKKEKDALEAGAGDEEDEAAAPSTEVVAVQGAGTDSDKKTEKPEEPKATSEAKPEAEAPKKKAVAQVEDSPEMKEARENGIKNYKLAVQHLEELIVPWAKIAKDSNEKTQKAILNGEQLLGWAYDGLASITPDEKARKETLQKAQAALKSFNKKYPDSKKVPICLQRIGTIYAELGDFQNSASVLDDLSQRFPDSEEGKKALMTLARSMHKIENFSKAIETVSKMFETKTDLSTKNLRWIATTLWQCGKERPKEAAALSLKASHMLFEALKKPVIEDWLTKTEQFEAQSDQKAIEKKLLDRREQLLCNAGEAAFWAEQYDAGIKYLDELLQAKKTAYFFKAKFLRGDTYTKMKDYEKAIADYGDVGGPGTDKESVRWDAGIRVGKLYLEQDKLLEAKTSFQIIAITPFEQVLGVEVQGMGKKVSKEEQEAQKRFGDEAVYHTALCAARLGEKDTVQEMVEKYKKFFPDGKYIRKIDSLPPADPPKAKTEPKKSEGKPKADEKKK